MMINYIHFDGNEKSIDTIYCQCKCEGVKQYNIYALTDEWTIQRVKLIW